MVREFLAERGALLPDDEALLGASWTLVDRSVFEILAVRAGQGLTVSDLCSAESLEMREATFSRSAVPGTVICARVVPDGTSHQFVGGVRPVQPGTEATLLDLLDDGDPGALAQYFGSLERSPYRVTRENEPLMVWRAVLAVADRVAARAVLDAAYEPAEDGRWVEMHQLEEGDSILRSSLLLDGDRVTIEMMSEPRMDRTLRRLLTECAGSTVLSDARRALRPGEMPPAPTGIGVLPPDGEEPTGADAAIRNQIQEQMERRWCDDHIPALAGLTSREAAADPTPREALERLLVSFDELGSALDADAFTMRRDRLRDLPGLDPR